jgi:SAM-dependent methyltransferase
MAHWSDADPTRTFAARATLYERGRPGYPEDVLDALLAGLGEPARLVVADVGAGTGLLSRALAARGCRVIAVEPNEAMRAAAPPAAGVEWRDGTGEATGLPAGCVALATVAQAFHWMEPTRALAELRRILAPGGRLALIWNDRRTDQALARAYDAWLEVRKPPERRGAPPVQAGRALEGAPGFEDVRVLEIGHEHRVDAESLIARTLSLSYAPVDPAGRRRVRDELGELHARHADASGLASLDHRCVAWLARRSD